MSGVLALQGGAVDGGVVRLDGKALTRVDPADVVRAGVVQVPEGRRVFADLTVEENLRAGGLSSKGRASKAAARDARLRAVPAARGAPHAARRPALRRRAADARHRPRADERAARAAARRAVARPRPADRRAHRRDRSGASASRGPPSCWSSRTRRWRSSSPTSAYVLEVGAVTLQGPAAELAASDEVRARYLGVVAEDADVRRSRSQAGEATDRRQPRELVVEGVTVRFGGLVALDDVSLDVAAGLHARGHRPQRRGQVDAAQRPHRRLPRQRGHGPLRRRCADRPAPAADRRPRRQPHLPEHRALAAHDGARQPAARPPPATRSPASSAPACGCRAPARRRPPRSS